jgi:hypothetical protein
VSALSQGGNVAGNGWNGDADLASQAGRRMLAAANQAEHFIKTLFDLKRTLVEHASSLG